MTLPIPPRVFKTGGGGSLGLPELNIPDFLGDFLDFENELSLFSLQARGLPFWDYIRYAVCNFCIYSRFGFDEPRAAYASRASRVAKEAWPLVASAVRSSFRPVQPYDLVVVNCSRTTRIDGANRNTHTYPLIKHLATDLRILLIDSQSLDVEVESLYPCDVLRSKPFQVLARLSLGRARFTASERATFGRIGAEIAARYGVTLNIEGIVREHFLFPQSQVKWYRSVLSRARPQAVVYVDDANQKAIIQAAHTLGIPCVDLQHALISPSNILYRYSTACKALLPTMSDYIFTFGEFWNSCYQLPSRRMAVGFPYFEQQRARVLDGVPPVARDKGIIIIGMVFSKDELVRMALELSAALPDHTVYYKLRAEDYVNWRQRYPAEMATRSNVVVIDSNDIPLYEWFGRCRYQVGINSTALCEGLGFGLTTFILNVGWYREMEYFYKHGHVFLIKNGREVADAIASGAAPESPLDTDALFAPNALPSLVDALRDVMLAGATVK